ncbi:MAG: tRNA lysidine(34) synthetase TilS [bacterium]
MLDGEPVLRSIHETIRRHGLLRKGSHVLVGVSGGADSVALLHALHFLRKRLGLRLSVAHLHHGIRGKAADRDETWVRDLAWRLGLPFVSERTDVPALARRRGISIEMAAREARYAFFARAIRSTGASVLATAHTADDQAETVLLRLLRGAGGQGLGGMAYRADRDGVTVIRPMLDVTHAEAVRFLYRHRRTWREDASNRDTDFLRNRVRHELLPLLEKHFNPQIRRALQRTASILREENEWVDALVRRALTTCAAREAKASLRVKALRKLPLAIRRRLIVHWLLLNKVEAEAVDFDAVERVLDLAADSSGTRTVPVCSRYRVARRYDVLSVERVGKSAKAFAVRLNVPGSTVLVGTAGSAVHPGFAGGYAEASGALGQRALPMEDGRARGNLVAIAEYSKGFERTSAEAYLSRAAVGASPLVLRSWRAGDRIRPLGMKGTKKVQDVFGDLKVPRDERARVPVLVCRGEVVWVSGYRVARGWEVVGPGSPSIRIVVRPEGLRRNALRRPARRQNSVAPAGPWIAASS